MRPLHPLSAPLLLVCLTLLPQEINAADPQFVFAYTSHIDEQRVGLFLHTEEGERLLTGEFQSAEAPSWSPDGDQIAFHAKVRDQWDIYIMDYSSGKSRALMSDPEMDSHPVWSPKGDVIAFHSERNNKSSLWLIEIDGNNLRKFPVQISGPTNFSWSPDGREVVFCANRRLTDEIAPPLDPEFVADSEQDIYIAPVNGRNPRRITKTGRLAMSPAWSPDGKQIAFALTEKPGNLSNIQIHVVNPDGTGLKKLTNDPGQNNCPKWSPDGGWLLYQHYPSAEMGERPKLVYLSRDGSQKKVLDVGKTGGYFPDFRKRSVKSR